MQAAMDTFYVVLRDGIGAINPERVMVLRGVQRPAVLVEENELRSGLPVADAFRLRWTEVSRDRSGTVPLAKLRCEIAYETAGAMTDGDLQQSGVGRGRALAAMDAELLEALCGTMQSAAKMDFRSGTAVPMGTRIFWSDPEMGATRVSAERVGRTATVEVWSLETASEEGSSQP